MSPDPKILSQQIQQQKQKLRKAADLDSSFIELSRSLKEEVEEIIALAANGSEVIPEISFTDIQNGAVSSDLTELVKKRGCAVIRQVFSSERVSDWNEQIGEYIESNQYYDKEIEKRGLDQYFSQLASGRPQIFGLYWSKPQIEARQSEELAAARRWLNRLWDHNQSGKPVFNPDQECSYADRLRRRQPGDSTLGLSPHVDGGSVERWVEEGFHNYYRHVYSGEWQKYDPFAAAHRTETKEIPSPAVCQMFRTFQGWTALTSQGPGEGTLQLIPIARGMAWILLRALQTDVAADDLCGAKAGRALSILTD
ncbi:MAG: YbiU family protein, partial [bacterium]